MPVLHWTAFYRDRFAIDTHRDAALDSLNAPPPSSTNHGCEGGPLVGRQRRHHSDKKGRRRDKMIKMAVMVMRLNGTRARTGTLKGNIDRR